MGNKFKILSLYIDHLSFEQSLHKISELGFSNTPSFVCFANVHMTIEAYKDKSFAHQLSKATLIAADGKPIAKACDWLYQKKQERIAGMDFMPALLNYLHNKKAKIFLFGSTPDILFEIQNKIHSSYSGLEVTGYISPPFTTLSDAEQQTFITQINNSGANFVFVALGCPKQEKWMADNYPQIRAVLLGVGGAFPVFAGLQKRSPIWMQKYGLEWIYRLVQEPKRLFKRYLTTNILFLFLLAKEWLIIRLIKR